MLVGINTLQPDKPGTAREDRWLRRLLETVRGSETTTEFVVLTDCPGASPYAPWPRLEVASEGASLSSMWGGGGGLANVVKQAGIDVLLTPLEHARAGAPAPQVLYALELSRWEQEPGSNTVIKPRDLKAIRRICAEARALVVSSEYLRRRCLDLFEAPLDKSIVATAGVEPVFQKKQDPMLDRPYFLTYIEPATIRYLQPMFAALAKRKAEFAQLYVMAGPVCEDEPSDWGMEVVRIEQCPDTLLASLYQHCMAFLYPGVHDGSAMRILEAMRAGALVVAPQSGASVELAAKFPFYYNPQSADSLVQTVRRVVNVDKDKRAEHLHLAQSAASRYAWDKSAWKLLSAFKRP
jgi:hypothetical protein